MKSIRKTILFFMYVLAAAGIFTFYGALPTFAAGINTADLPRAAADGEILSSGDYRYTVSAAGTVSLTGYVGQETILELPSSIDGKTVTAIAGYCDFGNTVEEITVPATVQTIGTNAFSSSTKITKVTIKGKNTLIGKDAFYWLWDGPIVCSSDSKAYAYAKENKISVLLTDGIDLADAKITLSRKNLTVKESEYPYKYLAITVTIKGKTLKEDTDYTCEWPSYRDQQTIGTKTITVSAVPYNAGKYTGSRSVTYDVVPEAPTDLRVAKITTSSLKLTWPKAEGATGYEIYRYQSSSKKYKKIKTIGKAGTTSYTDKKLKKNTSYKYRIIAWKKADGKTYRSAATDLKAWTDSGKAAAKSQKVKLKTGNIALKTKAETENYDNNFAVISAISDFFDAKGRYTIAYGDSKNVYISILNNSSLKVTKTLKIKKKYPLLGAVTGGPDGNYYIVWGTTKWESDKVVLAVSKYDKNGKFIKSCFLTNTGYHMDTDIPFDAGNCAVTFQNNVLICSYARQMINSHQSNDVFCVNIKNMTQNTSYENFVSHSFDQRVLALANGDVLFANLGDAGDTRGFALEECGQKHIWSATPFHFYGSSGYNWTYARLGGIGEVSTGIVLAGTSAPSMNSKYSKEEQQLFVQIINPATGKSILSGKKRSGTSCGKACTDTGIKWLTSYKEDSVEASSIVVMEKDRILVIWQKGEGSRAECYYTVLSASGKVLQKTTKIGKMKLNACEEIKYRNGYVYWTTAEGQKSATVHKLYIAK